MEQGRPASDLYAGDEHVDCVVATPMGVISVKRPVLSVFSPEMSRELKKKVVILDTSVEESLPLSKGMKRVTPLYRIHAEQRILGTLWGNR